MTSNCLSMINECKNELDKFNQSHVITPTQYIYAKQVLTSLAQIYTHREIISGILNENIRNAYITQITQLIAETGLIPGQSSGEILRSIDIRIKAFVEIYLMDKNNNDLSNLFREGFLGPPCFNGRLITLEHYAFSKYNLKNPLFYEFHTRWDKEAVALEEMMHVYANHMGLDLFLPPSLEALQSFFKEDHFNTNAHNILQSDDIINIYKRACQFFTGA